MAISMSTRSRDRVKAVRDLEWVMSSPHLLSSEGDVFLPPAMCLHILDDPVTIAWLEGLHVDPTPLHTFLGQQLRRIDKTSLDLGVYFTSLVEYWLRACPALCIDRLEVAASSAQLKFVFRCNESPWLSIAPCHSIHMHWEVSVKFFLLCEPTTTTTTTSSFINLGLTAGGETLASRIAKMQRKVRMCTENVSVSRWLSAHFEWTQANVVLQSHILLRGYLYYPLALLASTTSAFSSTHVELPSTINADHLRGWWSSDVEADLIRTTPPSSRFAILPKIFWLSKVSSAPSNDDDHTQHIVGSPGVPSLPLLSRADVVAACLAHFSSSPTAKPLVVAELRESEHATTFVEVSRGAVVNPNTWQPPPPPTSTTSTTSTFCAANQADTTGQRQQSRRSSRSSTSSTSSRHASHSKATRRPRTDASTATTVDFALDPLTTTTEPTQFIAQLSLALGDDGISYSVVKAEVARVLMHRKGRYLVQCLVVLVELEDGNLFRIGQLMLDARGLVHVDDDDDDGGIDHVMATIIPDKTKWWSVRFLLKAKHVLGGAIASSPRHDQVDSVTTLWVETVVLAMLEPQHKGKWHATAVDLCAAYALPRDDAVACQILSTLLDGRDGGAAAEAFGRTQRWDVASRRSSQLTHVYVNHPHTSAKAARRHLPATSSQIPTHDIADHAHQLSLVQATLDTPLTVHLVETSSQIDTMLTWMDRATNDKTMVVVGLDCEWRPRAFTTNPTCVDGHNDDLYDLGVTVVQLAFPNGHVFVLDCMATCVTVPAVFDRLCRPWIVVTGFCVSGDLDRLVGSYPALARTFQSPHWTCIDLRRVAMSRVRRLAGVGLASLAFTFLNHTMPKHQQCSDWAARPLTAAQVEYAALDAHIVRVLLLYFTADLNEPSICSTSTTCDDPPPGTRVHTNSWPSSWRVVHHLQSYLGEDDVAAAVTSWGLSGSFYTLPDHPRHGVMVKTVAWTVHTRQQQTSHYLAVVLDLHKTIDVPKLQAFVATTFLTACPDTMALTSERY
ncbi:hypothetical protein H257_11176 [Aphanomyces astaci]|uniref:3'-5' exonuclease domain-containing protein n=1 Tax=Aphanomyces astaci TaxID=112090 RepID=W4G3G1_APHAT|nr:hypothetical protein H257_11176 [Aphanomyces astaci]ETV74225.1 hypothetical protein H257_11176 [Aphanomyces astaci]|eukprot:XP_009836331.1 hypothetical protein H257_11176 [Aphanomyces astaci]